jgi:uncharacterized protein (DUF885 family)
VDILYNVGVWTEEQCKEFLTHYFPYKERIDEEIKRVQDSPGYNVCYLVGEHFFVELWAKFSKKFPNLKEYHNKVMECIDKAKECDFKGIEECMM